MASGSEYEACTAQRRGRDEGTIHQLISFHYFCLCGGALEELTIAIEEREFEDAKSEGIELKSINSFFFTNNSPLRESQEQMGQ